MTVFRLSVLVVCLVALPIFAQEPQPEGIPPEAVENERRLSIFQPATDRAIASEADVTGTNGTLFLESGSDVILRANNALRLQTGVTDRFWLWSNGHAAFGSAYDQGRLSLFEYGAGVKTLASHHRSTISTSVTQNDFAGFFQAFTDITSGVTNSGTMTGAYVEARNYGPGTLATINGIAIYAGNRGSGGVASTASVRGLFTQVQNGSGTIDNGYGIWIADTLATNGWGLYQGGTNDLNFFAGAVGIGTATPQQKLHVLGSDDAGTLIQVENSNAGSGAHAAFRTASTIASTSYISHGNRLSSFTRFGIPLAGWSEAVSFTGNGYILGTTLNTPVVLGTNNTERMRILGNGNVGIGTTAPSAKLDVNGTVVIGSVPNQPTQVLTVNGNAQFFGVVTGTNIRAHYQDLAEWVPSTTDLAPGTVVILNRARNNEVMASSVAYDTGVAGVVSAQPGITLGIEGEGMEQIATTGRVKVRVDARQNPVAVGDLLVTSDSPGTAMRSEPMDINGRKFHQPGTIIGKALEPLESGIGEILVLLSMQ